MQEKIDFPIAHCRVWWLVVERQSKKVVSEQHHTVRCHLINYTIFFSRLTPRWVQLYLW
jgi:hypothetical protein